MQHHLQRRNLTILSTLITSLLPLTLSHASGFRVPEVSVTGTAMSNALVANTEELGAVAYNPATISFHQDKAVMLGVNFISYEYSHTPSSGSKAGTTIDGVGEDLFKVPNLLVSASGANENKWSFALLVNAPFGLETEWADETFTTFAGGADVLEPQKSKIEMVNVNPNFSYKIDNTSSFSFGFDYYDVRNLTFNTQAIRIGGKGDGTGWNIGYVKKFDNLTLGAAYRSSVITDLTGFFDGSGIGSSSIGAKATLEFPDMLQFGAHYQATNSFGVELDIEHTGWSSFDTIVVKDTTGTPLSTSANNWKDTWAYRLGFVYKFSPANQIMFGYSYDETPQPDEFFSARVPDADRQLFSIGASHKFGTWKLEYAYMHVVVDERTVNSTTPFAGGESNGTTAYNGKYESDVDLLGISISTTF